MKTQLSILIASRNPGKVREFAALLDDLPIRWLGLDEAGIAGELPETGDSFAANARQKAETAAALWCGWALADDSGLCVAALDGRPGVYSARYGGPGATQAEKWALLLDELGGTPVGARTAWFECALALAHPDRETRLTFGRVDGQIGFGPVGDGGFGYDPLFIVDELGRTLAEATAVEKNRLSHRARAVAAMRPALTALAEGDAR